MSAQPAFLLSLIWVRHPHSLDPLGQDETFEQRRERIEVYIEEHCPVVFSLELHKKP